MAICVFTVRLRWTHTPTNSTKTRGPGVGPLRKRTFYTYNDYVFTCDTGTQSEVRSIVNTLYNAHGILCGFSNVWSIEVRELTVGERIGIGTKFQTWRCFGKQLKTPQGQIPANPLPLTEKTSAGVMMLDPKETVQEYNGVLGHQFFDYINFTCFEHVNGGWYSPQRRIVDNWRLYIDGVQYPDGGFNGTESDPFVVCRYEFARKQGKPIEQLYRNFPKGYCYLGHNDRLKIRPYAVGSLAPLRQFEAYMDLLAAFYCPYYLDGSDTLRVGYQQAETAVIHCVSDFHTDRRREYGHSNALLDYREKMIALEDAHHKVMNCIEIDGGASYANEDADLIVNSSAFYVLPLVRLLKCLLIRTFKDPDFTYPKRSEDFAYFHDVTINGLTTYYKYGKPPLRPAQEAKFFARLSNLLLADKYHLDTAIYNTQHFELALTGFIQLRTKFPLQVPAALTTNARRDPQKAEVFFNCEFFKEDYAGEWGTNYNQAGLRYNPGSGYHHEYALGSIYRISDNSPYTESMSETRKCKVIPWRQHQWIRDNYNHQAANEYLRLMECCLRSSNTFAYVARYVFPKDKPGTKQTPKHVHSIASGFALWGSYDTSTAKLQDLRPKLSWNDKNRLADYNGGSPKVTFAQEDYFYFCFPLNYDRRDIADGNVPYHDGQQKDQPKKKRKRDRDPNDPDGEVDPCADEETHRQQTRTWLYGLTRHKGNYKLNLDGEGRKELSQLVKQAGRGTYDLVAEVNVENPVGEGMIALAPEGHFVIDRLARQIDKCANEEPGGDNGLPSDAMDYVVERATVGLVKNGDKIFKTGTPELVGTRGFIQGGTRIAAARGQQCFDPLARMAEESQLVKIPKAPDTIYSAGGRPSASLNDWLRIRDAAIARGEGFGDMPLCDPHK